MSFGELFKRIFGAGDAGPETAQLTPEQLAVTPMPAGSVKYGDSVNDTFTNAIAQAKEHKRPVLVDLNGLRGILADAESSVEALMAVYNAAETALFRDGEPAAARIIAATPEQERLRAAQKQQTHIMQQHMDVLMKDLPQRLEYGLDSTIAWIGSFSKAANHLNVGYNHRAVISAFDRKGYSRLMADYPGDTVEAKGLRIIGTTLEQLERHGSVHISMSKHCAEYAHLASREKARNGAAENPPSRNIG